MKKGTDYPHEQNAGNGAAQPGFIINGKIEENKK